MLQHTDPDPLAQLRFIEFAAFKEDLQQFLIGFSHALHQRGTPLGGLLNHRRRNIGLLNVLTEVVLVDEGAILDQINDADQLTFSTDR